MIILAGGAGFIGSCFLWKLNEEGIDDVMVVDECRRAEESRNLKEKSFSDYIHKDDLLRMVKEDRLASISYVIHMGACSSTMLTDADYYMKNNFEYSRALAEWTISKKVPLLYASSAATYGDGSFGYSDSDENTRRLKPLNLYGNSKQLFDLWVLDNNLIDKVTGLKFFNVFGPNEYHKGDMRSVICKAFKKVRDEGRIQLFKSYKEEYADGEQKRDFIYVKDAVEAMYHLFKNPQYTGIYNLGTGHARSWNDLAKAMFAALGKEPAIEYMEMPDGLKDKYQYFTEADMTKFNTVTGGKISFRSLEDSVADYVKYLDTESYL